MNKLHEELRIDLVAIDQLLGDVIDSDQDLPRPSVVYDHIHKLITSGGKRLRPIMVVVGGRFGVSGHQETIMKTAALFEYMHMASLIHDDIIDRSDLRRGQPTLHKVTSVQTAIHVANYMMARVVEWAIGENNEEDTYRVAEIAAVVTELCIGEFGQLRNRFNFDLTFEAYLDKTKRKTALLMAECLKGGAKAAKADDEMCDLLFRFGEAVGIAFQIQDDVLDFTSPQEAIGKPAGADLRNGNVTLPVLFALEDPALAPHITSLHANSTEEEMSEIIALITQSSAIERSLSCSRAYAEQAQKLILPLSEHPAYFDLQVLARYFLK